MNPASDTGAWLRPYARWAAIGGSVLALAAGLSFFMLFR